MPPASVPPPSSDPSPPTGPTAAPTEHRPVITRFAPSPTGDLHIGGLRTALFSYLLAQKHGGIFYLRIEDTDTQRSSATAVQGILSTLQWAGLQWQDPCIYQSQRLALYQQHAQRLLDIGAAYRCFCSPERLQSLRQSSANAHSSYAGTGYDRRCRSLSAEAIQEHLAKGTPYTIRAKLPTTGSVVLHDVLRGDITFQWKNIEDFILLKSDGYPTYHLAHVVDDATMNISHVLRGSEWISTLPVHDFLWEQLGYTKPLYTHLPLILSPDGGKLSKRKNDTSVQSFRQKGYLAEALINFVVLLGWAYDDKTTFFTLDELKELFSLSKISKSSALFSYEKLDFFNNHYIKHFSPKDFHEVCLPDLQKQYPQYPWHQAQNRDQALQFAALYQSRLRTLTELTHHLQPFLTPHLPLQHQMELWQQKLEPSQCITLLESTLHILTTLTPWTTEHITQTLKQHAQAQSCKPFALFMPLRLALTGQSSSPSVPELLAIHTPAQACARIQDAITFLKHHAD